MDNSIAKRGTFWIVALIAAAALAAVLFLAISHGQPQDVTEVSLAETSEVPPFLEINNNYDEPGNSSLRVAIAGVLSPSTTLEAYQDLLTYMGNALDRQVTLILKPTYTEINDLVMGQRAEIAFVCSLAYVEGNQDFGMELLVAPQMNEEIVYYSYLIVPRVSDAMNLEDLRGASFAFTDPISNSGHLAPNYQLFLLGESPVSYFSRHIFTYSHDNSIMAVADELVDGAAVDSLVYNQMLKDNPELADKVKVIARWGPYGIPPVVFNPALDSQLKQQLRDFFLNMHNSDKGQEILNELDIDKFVIVNDDIYDSVGEMKTQLGW